MRSSGDFAAVIKQGKKYRTPRMVVHVLPYTDSTKADLMQVGFVVSKKVGNSVTRHRVVRQLRHIVKDLLPCEYCAGIVVRALPEAANASHADMLHDIERAWARFGLSKGEK